MRAVFSCPVTAGLTPRTGRASGLQLFTAPRPRARKPRPIRFKEEQRPSSQPLEPEETGDQQQQKGEKRQQRREQQHQQRREAGADPAPERLTGQEQAAQRQISHAAHEVNHAVAGILSSPHTQAAWYSAIALSAGAAALAALLAPGPLCRALFGEPALAYGVNGDVASVTRLLSRLAGATLLAAATVNFALREAARRGQLGLPTFRRLNVAVLLHGMLGLTVLSQGASVRTPQLVACVGVVCAAATVLAGRVYGLHRGGAPVPSLRAPASAALALVEPRNGAAAGYSALCLALAGAALPLFFAHPGSTSPIWGPVQLPPVAVFASRIAGAGMLLLAVVAYSLKDAAGRGVLGAAVFRWLNLGTTAGLLSATASLAGAGLKYGAAASPSPLVVLAMLAAAGFAACQYLGSVNARSPPAAAGEYGRKGDDLAAGDASSGDGW